MDKQQKLSYVVAKLEQLTGFLKPYLPLANVHNTNFVVSRHWDRMIPERIGLELLRLSDHELTLLPSGDLHCCESSHGLDSSCDCDTKDGCSFVKSAEADSTHGLKSDLSCNPHCQSMSDDIIMDREVIATRNCDSIDTVCEQVGRYSFVNSAEANRADSMKPDSGQISSCDLNPEHNSDDVMHGERIVTTNCDVIDTVCEKCEQTGSRSFVSSVEANAACRLKPDLTCSPNYECTTDDIMHREQLVIANCNSTDSGCEKCSFGNSATGNAACSSEPDLGQSKTHNPTTEYNLDDITHMEETVTTSNDLIDMNSEQSHKYTNVPNILTVSHPAESGGLPEWDHSLAPDWQHQSLREFITTAVSCTLPQLGLLTSPAELGDRLGLPAFDSQSHIVVSLAMKVKKSYEVDVMANMCAWIAKGFNISNVSSAVLLM